MATTKTQRIGIWVIAVFMAVGTIGSFAAIVLANQNSQVDQQRIQALTDQYQKDSTAHQAKVDAQSKELSDKYFDTLNEFSSRVGTFNADEVTELKTADLTIGEGEDITADSSFSAYYIGWNPTGVIFDSSIDGDSLKAPFLVTPGGVIEGWTQGAVGMKVGGIRELTIPAELAYGDTARGEDIPANTPLKFVMMIIPTPEAIPAPEMPKELLNYYQTGRI